MNQTPTHTDVMLLRNVLVNELAAVPADPGVLVPLRREFVEQILHALRHPRRTTDHWDAETLRPSVLAEMRRLSPSGSGVSKQRWDQQRNDVLPPSQRLCRMLNAAWSELIAEAGLKPNPYSRRYEDDYNPALDEPSADPESSPCELDDHDGLEVASVRVEVRQTAHVRTVTEIYQLR